MPDRRRVAVVTGASAGVGRATALAFAGAGFDVGLVARGVAGLEATVKETAACGVRSHAVATDVSSSSAVHDAAAEIETELGEIDVWVNDAMTTVFAPSWEVEPEDFKRAIEVTFLGQVWGTMAALERMRPRDRGSIVNVGSALAFVGIPLQSPYCAAKFACRGFFESVRAELAHEGSSVRISIVHLPAVNTPQFDWCKSLAKGRPRPVAPVYQPEVAARAILQVALDSRPTRVVGSWNKVLAAVGRLWPGLANQYAALGGWEPQLGDGSLPPERRFNLRQPVDDVADHGAHGAFDDEARGVADPVFVSSLPQVAKNLRSALLRAVVEKVGSPRARMGSRRASRAALRHARAPTATSAVPASNQ